MKKIISMIAAFCMFMSISAFAASSTNAVLSMTAYDENGNVITTAKKDDVITFSFDITADSNNFYLNAVSFNLSFDGTLMTLNDSLESKIAYTSGVGYQPSENKFNLSISKATSEAALSGDLNIAKFKATVTADSGTISFTKSAANATLVNPTKKTDKPKVQCDTFPTITIKGDDPEPVAPVIDSKPADSEGGIVGTISTEANAEDSTKFDWTIPAVAPIGKTVKVSDGTNNFFVGKDGKVAGTSASGAKLSITFEDNTSDVITYVVPIADIYGEDAGIAAFGKGTIADGDKYGIIFGGDISKKFAAEWNVGGIFAVEVNDAPAGDYTAQAYIGNAKGAVVEFTK